MKILKKIYDKPVVGCATKDILSLAKELDILLKNDGYTDFGLEWIEAGEVKSWFKGGITNRAHIELWNNGYITAHYDINIPHKQDPEKSRELVNEMRKKLKNILHYTERSNLLTRIKRFFKK